MSRQANDGKAKFQLVAEQRIFNTQQSDFATLITLATLPKVQNLVQFAPGVPPPHIGEI